MISISKAEHLPSFETEARGSSEMAYSVQSIFVLIVNSWFPQSRLKSSGN